MKLEYTINTEQDDTGCWSAEIPELAGAMQYGNSRDNAIVRVEALALRMIAEQLLKDDEPLDAVSIRGEA